MKLGLQFLTVGFLYSFLNYPVPTKAATYDLRLRTLVLYGGKHELPIATNFLNGVDTDYHISVAVPKLDHPSYGSIVVTYSGILDSEEWKRLREYAKKYDVRIVCLQTEPDFIPEVEAVTWNTQDDYLMFDSFAIKEKMTGVMCETCSWRVKDDGKIDPRPVKIINNDKVSPVLRLSKKSQPPAQSEDDVIAIILNQDTGPSELHFFMNAKFHEIYDVNTGSPNYILFTRYTELNLALANAWFEWVTRGLYLGKRRIYLQMHIDDWFTATQIYKGPSELRVDGDDVIAAVSFSDRINSILPKGSFVTYELAFNGAGFEGLNFEGRGLGPGLSEQSQNYKEKFLWVSHTWTHQNLDWLEPFECKGKVDTCKTSKQRLGVELEFNNRLMLGEPVDNTDFAAYKKHSNTLGNIFFRDDAEGYQKYYSRNSLVPPEISGLWPKSKAAPDNRVPKALPGNFDSISVLKANNIYTVTGDNSREELRSKVSPYHGIWTTKQEYGTEGILIVPRWAVNVFYNVHDIRHYMVEYNDLKACAWSSGEKCIANHTYSFDEAIDRQAWATTIPWLQYRPDPFMFHQANLHSFEHEGKTSSLVSIWAEKSIETLFKYINKLPIQSPKMDDIGLFYRERMSRYDCDIQAHLRIVDNIATEILTSGEKTCNAVLSMDQRTFQEMDNHNFETEIYGPEITFTIPVTKSNEQTLKFKQNLPEPNPIIPVNPPQPPQEEQPQVEQPPQAEQPSQVEQPQIITTVVPVVQTEITTTLPPTTVTIVVPSITSEIPSEIPSEKPSADIPLVLPPSTSVVNIVNENLNNPLPTNSEYDPVNKVLDDAINNNDNVGRKILIQLSLVFSALIISFVL